MQLSNQALGPDTLDPNPTRQLHSALTLTKQLNPGHSVFSSVHGDKTKALPCGLMRQVTELKHVAQARLLCALTEGEEPLVQWEPREVKQPQKQLGRDKHPFLLLVGPGLQSALHAHDLAYPSPTFGVRE